MLVVHNIDQLHHVIIHVQHPSLHFSSLHICGHLIMTEIKFKIRVHCYTYL